ncbi:MAG: deoxyguanosinetriphosphate triphosphohydrolase [Ruthenibacterium sp.]
MTVREQIEENERKIFAPYAAFSSESRGRVLPEAPCPMRACFQRDRDRIIHCKSFRRLKQKTQVFLSPEGDHYRTRLTHTLEVSQIARTIVRALRLNEDLAEAIAMGHDLGHTPFGHAGERALDALNPSGFKHYVQSVRVVEKLEKGGQGLNLTWEVRNGILCHTKDVWPATQEGCAVRYADRIAYINHDIEDAISTGVLAESDLPCEITSVLGGTKSQRITTLIVDLVTHSGQAGLAMSPEIAAAYEALHAFMYTTVYVDKVAKKEELKVGKLLAELYENFSKNPKSMPPFYEAIAQNEGIDRAVTDYISGMSDEFATRTFEEIFVPQKWQT